MTTYKGIKGFNIQTVSSDPSNPIVGQIWYNSTSSIVKYFASLPEAWSIGGNLSDKKTFMGGAGTATAGLSIGGTGTAYLPPKEEGYFPKIGAYGSVIFECNFGGFRPTFIDNAESDENGYGAFAYAPPSGFYSICTKNLSEYG